MGTVKVQKISVSKGIEGVKTERKDITKFP